ncbi:MAG: RNA polymerase factor sigma-54 [Fimbriimonadaceae bacterium]|nr:RNA polymerase factor sigma-54 [Fimbriimonadaceae bacterium]
MRQDFRQRQQADTRLQTRVDPRVIMKSQVVQLAVPELMQAIELELQENPALERLEEEAEPLTEEQILRTVAPQELKVSRDDQELWRCLPKGDAEQNDWLDLAVAPISAIEHLRAQLLPMLDEELRPLGELLIGSVDENGYLSCSVEEAALATGRAMEEVQAAIRLLQTCDPSGVGATSVVECLQIQLRDSEDPLAPLAQRILSRHMDEFVAKKSRTISRKCKVAQDLVEDAFDLIRSLNPYPLQGFHGNVTHGNAPRVAQVTPDVVLTKLETGWKIEVLGGDPASLTINREYGRRYHRIRSGEPMDGDEAAHVLEYVQRAHTCLDCLSNRRTTMLKVGEYLTNKQESFITTGRYSFLRPLTRSQMAADIGLHESTVSRATAGKFVQIATGEVVSFEVFFKPALRVQKLVEEILESEDPNEPLSDEEVSQILAKRGFNIARRTVNKYRSQLRLLSSRARRSA